MLFPTGRGASIPAPLSSLPGIQATQHQVFTFYVGPPHPPPYRHHSPVAAKPPSPKPSPSVGASKPPSTKPSPSGRGRPTTQHKVLHLLRGPTSQHVHHHHKARASTPPSTTPAPFTRGRQDHESFSHLLGGPPNHPAPRLHLPGVTTTPPEPSHHSYWSRSPRGQPGPPTVRPPFHPSEVQNTATPRGRKKLTFVTLPPRW